MSDPRHPRVAVISSHFSGVAKLDTLRRGGLPISQIITVDTDTACKAQISGYHDFASYGERHGIPVHCADSLALKSAADQEFFHARGFDILLISGWQRIIPETILNAVRIATIGEHGSSEYLPRGRGHSPINWSLIENRRRFVLHLFAADAGIDSGPIIACESIELDAWDTIESVYLKVGITSGRMFLAHYQDIVNRTVQYLAPADLAPTYLPRRREVDDTLEWQSPTLDLFNKVRAISRPYPGARTLLGDTVLQIWSARPFAVALDDFSAAFGEVLATFPGGKFAVKTLDGVLLVDEYEGATVVQEGDVLGSPAAPRVALAARACQTAKRSGWRARPARRLRTRGSRKRELA